MSLPTLSSTNELAIAPEFLVQLDTPEDFEHAFQQVSESKNQCIWWEADILLAYYKKYLRPMDIYRAGQLMNNSTVKYYLRTAAGFPPETRIPSISFNHHYQATFADGWDSKTLKFQGEKRFVFAEKAADEGLSTRKLKTILQDEQNKQPKTQILGCIHCPNGGDVEDIVIYRSSNRSKPLKIHVHSTCWQETLTFLIQAHDIEV